MTLERLKDRINVVQKNALIALAIEGRGIKQHDVKLAALLDEYQRAAKKLCDYIRTRRFERNA
jgi:hypothetical protein